MYFIEILKIRSDSLNFYTILMEPVQNSKGMWSSKDSDFFLWHTEPRKWWNWEGPQKQDFFIENVTLNRFLD